MAALRLDPLNAEAKEIIAMIEAGGGAPEVGRRTNRPRQRPRRVRAATSWPKRPAGSKKDNMRAPKPC